MRKSCQWQLFCMDYLVCICRNKFIFVYKFPSDENIIVPSKNKGSGGNIDMRILKDTMPKHGVSVLWSSRTISLSFAWAVISYATYFATNKLGLNAGIVGVLFLLSKIADCISNFVIANIVDNGNSPLGKARPYEIHIVLLWLDVILMFSIPSGWGDAAKYILIFLFYTINCAVCQTFLMCTDAIYLKHTFTDEKQRNLIQAVTGGLGMIAMFAGIVAMPTLVDHFEKIPHGWTIMTAALGVPMAVIGTIRFIKFPEQDASRGGVENKVSLKDTLLAFVGNKYVVMLTAVYFCTQLQSNILTSPSSYYFTYVVGNLSAASIVTAAGYIAALSLFIAVPLANKFGRKNVLLVGGIICVIGCGMRWFAGDNLVLLSISNILSSIVTYPWSAFAPLMLIEVMEYGEWKNGRLIEGAVFAATGLGSTIGQGLGGSVSGMILGACGFDGLAKVQTELAITGIKVCYAILPAIIMVISVIIFAAYDLEGRIPKIKAELEERKQSVAVNSEA